MHNGDYDRHNMHIDEHKRHNGECIIAMSKIGIKGIMVSIIGIIGIKGIMASV